MTVSKIGDKVEVSGEGIYLYLPANRIGYQLFEQQVGSIAEKYRAYFVKKIIARKRK